LSASVPKGADHLLLGLRLPETPELFAVIQRVRRMFDLDTDPARISGQLAQTQVVGKLVKANPGRRVPGAWDPFELAVRAILGQQISVKGATTLAGRLVSQFGKPLKPAASPELTHLFPEPKNLIRADLVSIGLTGGRMRTIQRLAEAVHSGKLPLGEPGDPDDLVRGLMAIAGIGDWTAQYVAMRALGDPDAIPAGDLGLRKAVAAPGETATTAEVRSLSESWRPWRATAAMHLWASL
jgi:AraC family transcriptional regulator of adaptative response / DNA-3-methyladenine glycosylase II